MKDTLLVGLLIAMLLVLLATGCFQPHGADCTSTRHANLVEESARVDSLYSLAAFHRDTAALALLKERNYILEIEMGGK